MPSIGNISRLYSYDNRMNGNLGPTYFLRNNTNNNPNIPKVDLVIYIVLSKDINTELINSLQQISEYKITIKQYIDSDITKNEFINDENLKSLINTNSKRNSIKNEIKNDKNSKKFLILDNIINNNYEDLKITYKSIDTNNIDIDNIIQYIYFMLFSENTLKI